VPINWPPRRNSTRAIADSSVTVAVRVTVPPTVAPVEGEVRVIHGGVWSAPLPPAYRSRFGVSRALVYGTTPGIMLGVARVVSSVETSPGVARGWPSR